MSLAVSGSGVFFISLTMHLDMNWLAPVSMQQLSEDVCGHGGSPKARGPRVRQRRLAVGQRNSCGQFAEQRRRIHRNLGEPEAEAADAMGSQQMAGMRRAALAPPAAFVEVAKDAQVFDDPVAERDIELKHVAILAQPGVAQQVSGIVAREQILSGRQRQCREAGDLAM